MAPNFHAHNDDPWTEAGYDTTSEAPEQMHRGLDGELQWNDSAYESGE